jgi:uncharacterized protein YegP (UPF0339 family)
MYYEIYKGRKLFRQCWRWRAVAVNGELIATSGEAFFDKGTAVRSLNNFIHLTGLAPPVRGA